MVKPERVRGVLLPGGSLTDAEICSFLFPGGYVKMRRKE